MSSRPLTLETSPEADREEALRRLVQGRLEAGYRLATLLLGDRNNAEEATHDAVVRALKASHTLRDVAAFDAWFRRILVNACRDVGKKRRATATEQLQEASPSAPSEDPTGAWVEHDAIRRALRSLSVDHREVVVLRFYADLSVEHMAGSLGIREGTVKSRLHYALQQLRAEFDAAERPTQESLR